MPIQSDCLVLKIDEFDQESRKLDTTIYVVYDANAALYVIRGKRVDELETYSFYCYSLEGVKDFISMAICKKNLWSYSLYACNNLPLNSDNITFGNLNKSVGDRNEIVGYDYTKYSNKSLKKMLGILRNVYNYY
jgi:hypothetical protein